MPTAAHIEETILISYEVNSEGLRDLDAVLNDKAHEYDPLLAVEYEVLRKDGLRYVTRDIDDVTRESNGKETGVTRLSASFAKPNEVDFNLAFSNHGLRLVIDAEDRAKTILLASEMRNLSREKMRIRGRPLDALRLLLAFFIIFTATFSTLSAVSNVANNSSWATYQKKYDAQTSKFANEHLKNLEDRVNDLKTSGTLDDKADFIIDYVTGALALGPMPNEPDEPVIPWYFHFWAILALSGVAGAFAALVAREFWPGPRRVILIGAAVAHKERMERIRERVVWGIGATLVLGIVTGVISAQLTPAN